MRAPLATLLALAIAGCGEFSPRAAEAGPVGCWRLEGGDWAPPIEPGPVMAAARVPEAVELSERAFLVEVSEHDRQMHRFDPAGASEAHMILPDTALRVAWWRDDTDSIGVGNYNRFGGWYLAGVVSGDRLEGEMRWVRYAEDGEATASLHRADVVARREDCT